MSNDFFKKNRELQKLIQIKGGEILHKFCHGWIQILTR